jgi:hypothetical protein
VFGNSLGNSQVFTGSVLITGSLTIAGASSATSYSGTTIFGSTIACSPIGCFATSCATSFIGGTMSGTTIYGSTAVCSPVGLFSGCVGIGTQTPQSILHAQSGANVWSFNGGCACTPYNNNSNGFYTNAGNISITSQYGTINWPEDYTTLSTTKPWWMLGNRSGTAGQWTLTLRTGYSGSGGLDREVIGVYTTGTDTARTIACIRLSTGAGVEAMKIDSAGASTFSSTISGTTIYGSTAVCSLVGYFSGCVGIGTSSPATKLDVLGDARIQGAATGYAVFNLLDNTASGSNWAILSGFPSLGNFTIRESGVANHLIIAKTTGAATFSSTITGTTIYGSTTVCSPSIIACTTSAAAITIDGYSKLSFKDRGTEYGTINASRYNFGGESTMMSFQSGNCFLFLNGTNCLMFIGSNGNVGIGTSSPSQQLSFGMLTNSATRTYTTDNQGTLSFYNLTTGNLEAYLDIASVRTGNDSTLGGSNIRFLTQSTSSTISGCERMRITSGGLVGIGTSSPAAALNVSCVPSSYFGIIETTGTSTGTVKHFRVHKPNCVEYGIGILADNSFHISTASTFPTTNGFTITSGGCVGIGTTPLAGQKLIVNIASTQNIRFSSEGGQATISGVNGDATAFAHLNIDANVLRLQSNASGNVSIGTATDFGYKLNLNGQPGANGYTAWTNWSDSRLKENVTDLEVTNVLDKINRIRPVTYNYNELSGFDETTRARRISGFIAQELMEVFPDMVGTIKKEDTEYYDTNLSNLNLYLVKAIQELKAENDIFKTCLGIS